MPVPYSTDQLRTCASLRTFQPLRNANFRPETTAALENAKVTLSYTDIRSSIDGKTGTLLVKQGNLVPANTMDLIAINQILWALKGYTAPDAAEVNARARTLAEKTGNLGRLVQQLYGAWTASIVAGSDPVCPTMSPFA